MDNKKKKVRILLAKPGLDGHFRGALVLMKGLRDAGFEVIYTGMRQTPESIASAAVQEDVDVVGLSSLSGSHNTHFPRVVELLSKKGMPDVLVIGGGIIPDKDILFLKKRGISECFGPGTSIKSITEFINRNVRTEK